MRASKPLKRRRYKIGENPIYDRERAVWESRIDPAFLTTRDSILGLLALWKGDAEGMCIDRGELVPSRLLAARQKLQAVMDDFEGLKQKAINAGKSLPKEMPPKLMERKLVAEAQLDVARSEIKRLKEKLSDFDEEEDKRHRNEILKGGPIGSGKLQRGVLHVLDGQQVSEGPDGLLFIDQKGSPYHGLPTSVYFEDVVKPWKRRMAKFRAEKSKFHRLQMVAAQEGESFDGEMPKKPKWPPIPKDCKLVKTKNS